SLPTRAATPNRAFAVISAARPLATTGPIAPLVGPVASPRINGQSLFAPPSHVGITPTIDWTAPAVGTPSFYTVTLRRLFLPAGSSTVGATTVVSMRTKG